MNFSIALVFSVFIASSLHGVTKNELALIDAAIEGDVKRIKITLKQLQKGKDNIDAFEPPRRISGEEGYMDLGAGPSALQGSVKRGHAEVVKILLAAGASTRDCILWEAEKDPVFDLLVAAGADGSTCITRLLVAARSADVRERESPNARLLHKLFLKGLDVNYKDEKGQVDEKSLLHLVVEGGNPEWVEVLIKNGADVNYANQYFSDDRPLKIAKELLENYTSGKGKAESDAAERVKEYQKIIKLLKAAGAK